MATLRPTPSGRASSATCGCGRSGRTAPADRTLALIWWRSIGTPGDLAAIQCKFYAPHHAVAKADIDTFFAESGKAPFARRIVVSTTDKWSKNAESTLIDQQIPTTRLDIS
jgi:predicted helicase